METSKTPYLQNEQDDLTNDQIKQLLKSAELRLQGQIAQSPRQEIFSESVVPRSPHKCDSQISPYHLMN